MKRDRLGFAGSHSDAKDARAPVPALWLQISIFYFTLGSNPETFREDGKTAEGEEE